MMAKLQQFFMISLRLGLSIKFSLIAHTPVGYLTVGYLLVSPSVTYKKVRHKPGLAHFPNGRN